MEATDDAEAIAARDADILGGLERAISALADMRTTGGAALRRILEEKAGSPKLRREIDLFFRVE